MIDSEFIVGVVRGRGTRGIIPSATLVPLYRLSPDAHAWHPLTDADRQQLFPNNGSVSWLYVPEDLSDGSVWRFKIDSQPSYDERPEDPWRDRYKVAHRSERQLLAVIDVDEIGGEPLGRERLCTQGVRLHTLGPTHAWVKAESKLWCLLPFVPKKDQASLHVIADTALEQPLRFTLHEGADPTFTLAINGEARTFLQPDRHIDGAVVLRDWSPDPVILKRVMGRLRKWDRTFAESLKLSEKAIERVEAILATPPTSIHELDMERARFARARAYLSSLTDAAALGAAARTAIEEGPLAVDIQQQKESLLEAETAKARQQAEQRIQATRDKLDQLRKQVAAIEQERSTALAALDAVRHKDVSFLNRFDEVLESKLTQILEKPEEVLADVAILKVIQRVVGGSRCSGIGEPIRSITTPAIRTTNNQPITAYTDLSAFTNAFQAALIASDTPPSAWRAVFSSLLGGGMPILTGARARNCFEAFARVATRGELTWVQVEPTWNSLRDAIQGGIGELLLDLGRREGLQLIVLEGVNRAPVESYLCPLLSDLANTQASAYSADPRAVANGTSAHLVSYAWPQNVLLGGIVVEGITSLGLPVDCLSGCTIVLTDELRAGAELDILSRIHPALRAINAKSSSVGEVALDVWTSWREIATQVDLSTPIAQWQRLVAEHHLSRLARDRFLATYAASRIVTSSDDPAISDSFAYVLLPLVVASGHRHDLGEVSFEYRDHERAAEVVRKLIRT